MHCLLPGLLVGVAVGVVGVLDDVAYLAALRLVHVWEHDLERHTHVALRAVLCKITIRSKVSAQM